MALTTGQKAGWGLCDMGVVTFVVIKQLVILSFLTTVMGVPVVLAGWVTTSILLFDIITDPMIGSASDKTQSKWGRRAPWMFWGAIVMAIGTVGIFMVPEDLAQEFVIGWVGLAFAIATIGFTMVTVPYSAMSGEITSDPKERSQLTAWRMTFASLGIFVGAALPMIAGMTGYTMAALVLVPFLILPIWASIFFTRNVESNFRPTQLAVGEMAKYIFTNWPFVVLFVNYGIMTLAVATMTAGLPFAALYLFSYDGSTSLTNLVDSIGTVFFAMGLFVIGSLLSQVFWVLLSNAISKLGALILGICFYMGLLLFFYVNLPIDNLVLIAVIFLLIGFANGSYQQIPFAMYPDLMDLTRMETGQRIEGAFSAVWLFGQKVANAVGPLLLASIIGFFGYKEARGGVVVEQSPEALEALTVAMTLFPACVFGVSVIILAAVYYPLLRSARARVAKLQE